MASSPLQSALESRGQRLPQPIRCRALIDTGATRTVIREGLAAELGLRPVSRISVKTPNSSNHEASVFSVQLIIPPNSIADLRQVVEMPLQEQSIDVLIGRDILRSALLMYHGPENLFTLALQVS